MVKVNEYKEKLRNSSGETRSGLFPTGKGVPPGPGCVLGGCQGAGSCQREGSPLRPLSGSLGNTLGRT